MSTISAGTTSNSALVTTGDTTGVMTLQTNGTTPALTLNTSQALGVGSSPSYGTSGQVLTSGGSSAAPTWATPSAGAMTLISTQTVTSANQIVWTGLSTYNKYIVIIDYMIGNSGGYQMPNYYLRVGYSSGPTYRTSNYNYSTVYRQSNSYAGYLWSGSTSGSSDSVSLNALSADPNNGAFAGTINIENFLASNGACSVYGLTTYYAGYFNNPTGPVVDVVSGQQLDTGTANTAIKIYIGSGTFNGKASLYGISS